MNSDNLTTLISESQDDVVFHEWILETVNTEQVKYCETTGGTTDSENAGVFNCFFFPQCSLAAALHTALKWMIWKIGIGGAMFPSIVSKDEIHDLLRSLDIPKSVGHNYMHPRVMT